MDAKCAKKNGKLRLERGGQWAKQFRRAPVAITPDWDLDREMRAAFAAFEGEDGGVPSRGIYAIRSEDQHPWRVLARRMREAHAKKVPKSQAVAVLAVFAMWLDELYAETDEQGIAA